MNNLISVLLPFIISVVMIPVVKRLSIRSDAWAKQNERTIHHGIISRIGGIAIYLAFSITMAFTFQADRAILGIYLASSLMFFTGLADDFLDLPPKVKLLFQLIAALILMYFGVRVDAIRVFGFTISSPVLCGLFTIFWVVGIINAINLLDGLDGLCGGMILVVLSVVIAISLVDRRGDIVSISLILGGSILGFLVYNAHPASIFMGDCGSLFLGCVIASVSLLGFKSSTVVTLAFPMLILILPIVDTLSAILRRKIEHMPVDHADKSHLHHQLMRRFGQTNSVIIMCGITFVFGMCAFLYIYSRPIGIAAILIMFVLIELFIEKTGMISRKFHPMLSLLSRLISPRS